MRVSVPYRSGAVPYLCQMRTHAARVPGYDGGAVLSPPCLHDRVSRAENFPCLLAWRKRLVKARTKRFRGNAINEGVSALSIGGGTLSVSDEDACGKGARV